DAAAELVDARLLARADVVGAGGVRAGGGDEGGGDVADVDVVARLLTAAEHPRLGAGEQGGGEDRHHTGLPVRVLARPVDVAEPQRGRLDPVQPAVQLQVALGGELRLPVGGVGPALGALVQRQVPAGALAVDRTAGGGEDETLDPGAPSALE